MGWLNFICRSEYHFCLKLSPQRILMRCEQCVAGMAPSSYLLQRVSAGRYLCSCSMLWSLTALLIPACTNWSSLMGLRFIMGELNNLQAVAKSFKIDHSIRLSRSYHCSVNIIGDRGILQESRTTTTKCHRLRSCELCNQRLSFMGGWPHSLYCSTKNLAIFIYHHR
jgi:hypothetical protein